MKHEESEWEFVEKPIAGLRYIIRNGEKILQQRIQYRRYSKLTNHVYAEHIEWQDVPTIKETI